MLLFDTHAAGGYMSALEGTGVDFRQQLFAQLTRVLQDPRVSKALQHPALAQGVMQALQLRARMQGSVESSVERVAKTLNLATSAEVRELRRTVRRLERELAAYRAGDAPDANNGH